jgi:hypothetical protein
MAPAADNDDDDKPVPATFAELGLAAPLCEACAALGYSKPTPIQTQAIPYALSGRDIIGLAETGSGKTAAFALPILHRLLEKPQPLYALVIAPTRELAFQISEQLEALGSVIGVRCATIVGGIDMMTQVRRALRGLCAPDGGRAARVCAARAWRHARAGGARPYARDRPTPTPPRTAARRAAIRRSASPSGRTASWARRAAWSTTCRTPRCASSSDAPARGARRRRARAARPECADPRESRTHPPSRLAATSTRSRCALPAWQGFSLRSLKVLVLDEADKLLAMDFEKEIDKILAAIPAERNTYLFSATMTSQARARARGGGGHARGGAGRGGRALAGVVCVRVAGWLAGWLVPRAGVVGESCI